MRTRHLLGVTAAVALLAACGGGGGDDAPPMVTAPAPRASEIPLSAQQSAAGAFDFVASVAATRDDGAEPLFLGDATLAVSDTDEPRPLQ